MTTNYNIVISINVHEKPEYLFDQLDNINQYIKLKKFIIILNCNDFMFNELSLKKNILLSKNAIVNPIPINKRTHNGSLFKGIVSNMKYAVNHFDFDYFLIMSSREFFYKPLENYQDIESNKWSNKSNDYHRNDWFWPKNRKTKLLEYIINNKLYFDGSPHEGICFNKNGCVIIIDFLNKHSIIENDLYNFTNPVEEYALQTICCNFESFYYLGNGCYDTPLEKTDKNKFTLKKPR
jgi:hypothetical protein